MNAARLHTMKCALLLLPLLLCACTRTEAQRRGCQDSYQVPDVTRLQTELGRARARWQAANIQNYSYIKSFQYSMEASGQHKVTVEGEHVTPKDEQSMPQIFNNIQAKINEAAQPKSCTMLEARYSPKDGHILSIYHQNVQQGIEDAFGGYTIEHFGRK